MNDRDLAAHLNRVIRRQTAFRAVVTGQVVRDLPGGGWIVAAPGQEAAEFASASGDRARWLNPAAPVRERDARAALDVARELGRPRVFFWFAPWALGQDAESMLGGLGIVRVPHVEYLALARPAGEVPPRPETALRVRVLGPQEGDAALAAMGEWRDAVSVDITRRMVRQALAEAHAAFEGDRPVSLGLLTIDGAWAYLSAGATLPQYRGLGAQSALIASRVARARELGASWCSCETNTALETSLRNLRRGGFKDLVRWRVCRWDDPGPAASR